MRLTRNFPITIELTPEECAEAFMHGDTHFQAEFLNTCGQLAETPEGSNGKAWFDFQLAAIRSDEGVPQISDAAKYVLRTMVDYLCDAIESADNESLRIANARIADLENGLTKLHEQFDDESYYSWQRVLYRVKQLIHRRNACAEACLNAIGFLDGSSAIDKYVLIQRLVEAIKPLVVSVGDECPEFHQVAWPEETE